MVEYEDKKLIKRMMKETIKLVIKIIKVGNIRGLLISRKPRTVIKNGE